MIARVLVALLFGVALGQSTFEAADVHVSTTARRPLVRGQTFIREGRYEMHNASLLDLIIAAYNVRAEYVIGGPSWLELDRFDVIAKTPARTTREEQMAM